MKHFALLTLAALVALSGCIPAADVVITQDGTAAGQINYVAIGDGSGGGTANANAPAETPSAPPPATNAIATAPVAASGATTNDPALFGENGFPLRAKFGDYFVGPNGCEYVFAQTQGGGKWYPRLNAKKEPICRADLRS